MPTRAAAVVVRTFRSAVIAVAVLSATLSAQSGAKNGEWRSWAGDLGATRWQAFYLVTLPQIRTAIIGAALISAAISLDDFIIASFTIGGGNTLSTFVWGKLRTTLDPSINAIATILLLSTIGMSVLALRLTRYRG